MTADETGQAEHAVHARSSVIVRVQPWFRFCELRFFGPALSALLFGATLVCAPAAHALKSDADQPINIRARRVDANEKTGVSVYRGDVVMTQGSLRIEADRLEVTLRNGRTDLIRAWGKPAHLHSRTDAGDDINADAARLEYRAKAQRVDLFDDVKIERNADVFSAAVAHYSIDAQTFTAEGGGSGQVTATIQPAKKETTP